MQFKIGQGFDVHAVEKGNEVILGGMHIPAPFALKGFSDADVLLHAITDALLGAVAEHDIGFYFPPGKEENKNRASKDFLLFAYNLVLEKGYKLVNLDSTVLCEQPKVNPHREDIRKNIAKILQVKEEQISVKATTSEKLGFTGRGEGIAAQAVVLIEKIK